MGRRIENSVYPVTMWWTAVFLICMVLFGVSYHPPLGSTVERGFGWFLIYIPLIPGGILTMISWFFPSVRVYHCHRCGAETECLLRVEKAKL